ncbi:MAG: hypothetical protein E7578_00425 [Ruminococcaceae bacterium]|nr:hypothetical protein [Oscillospiraceae bacterium]
MVIDLTVSKKCLEDLIRFYKNAENLYDEIRKIQVELSDDDTDSFEELSLELYEKMNDIEVRIGEVKSMIQALDSVMSVYERTEKKNINKMENMDNKLKDTTRLIAIDGQVPDELADLFRQN